MSTNTDLFRSQYYYQVGMTEIRKGDYLKAIDALEISNSIDPNYLVFLGLGIAYHRLGNPLKAEFYYKEALKNEISREAARTNLGLLYVDTHSFNKAIDEFTKAAIENPKNDIAIAHLALNLLRTCDFKEFNKWSKKLDAITKHALNNNLDFNETPFINIARKENPLEALKIASYLSKKIKSSVNPSEIFTHKKHKKKILNIGYITNDLEDHPIAHIIADLFSSHNRKRFKIFAYYYNSVDTSNIFYKKAEKGFDKSLDISELNHFEAAKKIYEDKIDILIDLKGFSGNARPAIFAYKPSPIQITYLGFPGACGNTLFDYTIVDKTLVPKGNEKYYSEKLIFMPHCYQVNSPRDVSRKNIKREDFNLPKNAFVLACFNSSIKINKKNYNLWLRILKKVPKSVLWLHDSNNLIKTNLLKIAKRQDLDKRIVFAKRIPLNEHLKRHSLADLALDTFHYSGGATTSHAMWMNLPVITLAGKSYVSRMGASILSAAGTPELICKSEKEYENLAVSLAKNPKKIKIIEKKLSLSNKKKLLFDIKKFTKSLETGYLEAWDNYLKGNYPKNIHIVR